MGCDFFLMTEGCFHPSYLVSSWYEQFNDNKNFKGVIIRGPRLPHYQERVKFHKEFTGEKMLSREQFDYLSFLYGDLTPAERAMIKLYGLPAYPPDFHEETIFLEDINGAETKSWLSSVSSRETEMFLFIFLDQLLKPFWIDMFKGNIINAHSAVLPYARGFHAIENIACQGNLSSFMQAAGASVHLVDNLIDHGPIVKVRQITQPLQYDSIWEIKGASFKLAFDLLIETAEHVTPRRPSDWLSELDAITSYSGPIFYKKNFTNELSRLAESQFLRMKLEWS